MNNNKKNKNEKDENILKKEILQNYWEDTGNIDFIKKLFKVQSIKKEFNKLAEDQTLFFTLKKQINSDDFKRSNGSRIQLWNIWQCK